MVVDEVKRSPAAEPRVEDGGGIGTPRVSVVMNVFNGEAFLAEAIDSVLAQSFRDWELVIWDDRSEDGSAAVVARYDDPRIRYHLAPEWTPLGDARRAVIEHARGEWIAFLDQDDVWAPDKLELQMRLADEEGEQLGLIFGRATAFTPRGRERDQHHRMEFRPLPEGEIFEPLFVFSCFICLSTAVVRRSAYDAVGGIAKGFEDAYDYYLYVALAERFRARALQETCCWYRVHGFNMTNTHRARIHQEVLWLLDDWTPKLPPKLAAYRKTVHSTLLGLEEMWTGRSPLQGLRRILRDGSLAYLAQRPFVRSYRMTRRNWRRLTGKDRRRRRPGTEGPRQGPPQRFQLGRVPCTTHTREQLLEEVARMLDEPPGPGRIVNCVNPHIYNLAENDPELLAALGEARVTGADGMGVVWSARLFGQHLRQRCDMIDSFGEFLRDTRFPPNRALLMGGYEGLAELAAEEIERVSVHCRVVRAVPGFLEDDAYLRLARETPEASFILVGMGTPKSERIVARLARERPDAIVWHVGGGTIEIYAGAVNEPPDWMKRTGLHWVHRFATDPGRMWRRYLVGHPRFVLSILRAWLRRRRGT